MRHKIDLAGKRFGRLVVIKDSGFRNPKGMVLWLCACDCGKQKIILGSNIRSGTTVSCGCYAAERASLRRKASALPPRSCNVNGCKSITTKGAFGMCGKHYARFKRYGDVNYVTPEDIRRISLRNAQPNLGKLMPKTYKKFLGKHEHRQVVEKFLGRKLRSDELVHHIDENPHNNDISNLQIVTRAEHARIHAKNTSRRRR